MTTADLAAERARSAALRLKHDLGKAVRFRAPKEPEADDSALRERLARDLLATRETPEERLSAPEVFARWRREEEAHLGDPHAFPEVTSLASVIAEMEGLLARLDTLDRNNLLRLDVLAREVGALCRAVFARVDGRAS